MLTLSNSSKKNFKTWSNNKKNKDITTAIAKTINAPWRVSFPVGQETLQGALMVFAMAVVMSIFFLLLDQVLKFFLEILLKVSI